jgi:hypothetical protein
MARGHAAQFTLESAGLDFGEAEKLPGSFQPENQPVENAPLLGQVGRVVDFGSECFIVLV